MNGSLDWRERLVGGFILASGLALVLLFAVAVYGSGLFERNHHFTLVLDEGTGLSAGVPVTIAGMKVGKVASVRLTDDRRVELVLEVHADYAGHVKADSVGEASMTLSGKVVRIGPGSPDAPVLADGGELVPGHNFDVMRALEKMDLVHNLERLEAILVDLNELASQLRLGDGKIPEAMDAMMALVGDLQEGRGTIGRLLKDDATLDEVLAAVEAVDEMAGKVESAAVALEKSTEGIDGAGQAIVEGADHIGRASQALSETASSVDRSAAKLAASLDRLDAGLAELEKTMRAVQEAPFVRSGVRRAERDAEDEAPAQ